MTSKDAKKGRSHSSGWLQRKTGQGWKEASRDRYKGAFSSGEIRWAARRKGDGDLERRK